MQRTLLFKAVAVAGALLLGGLYVYDRAGGNILPAIGSPPASEDKPADAGQFYSTKWAPIFPADAPHAQLHPPASSTELLPGSKSLILVSPQGVPAVEAESPAQQAASPGDQQLLPGSKSSVILVPYQVAPQQAQP